MSNTTYMFLVQNVHLEQNTLQVTHRIHTDHSMFFPKILTF